MRLIYQLNKQQISINNKLNNYYETNISTK